MVKTTTTKLARHITILVLTYFQLLLHTIDVVLAGLLVFIAAVYSTRRRDDIRMPGTQSKADVYAK